jgi:hypothetical protein
MVLLVSFFLPFSSSKADAPIIEHTIADDGWVEVPLDFTFPFYGNSYVTSFMFANGVVGFLDPLTVEGSGYIYDGLCCSGQDFSSGATGVRFNFTIMPWHTDLIDTGPGHFYTQGDSTYQKYMWEGVDEYYQTTRENTFDLTIYPLGNIKMTYEELDIANHSVTVAVVGDLSQGQYTQWFYNHPTNGAIYWDTSESAPVEIGEGASICDVVPLSSLICNYYPEAYADAYYEEQCAISSLYDSGCVGYWQAYTDQQCSINSLWSISCPNYETTYFNQQCSLNSLWSTSCPNYETAYLDNQCETNPLYSVYCPGYALAIAEEEIEQEIEEEFEEEWEEYTYEVETTMSWDNFEFFDFTDMPTLEDYSIADDYSSEPEMEYEMTFEEIFQELEIELMEAFQDFEMPVMEDTPEDFEEPEMEELMEEPETEEPIDEPEPEEETVQEEQEQEEPEQEEIDEPEPEPEPDDRIMLAEAEVKEPTKKEKMSAKEKKMREIITNKLKSLAIEVGEASTLQAQKDLQSFIIALLNYNSGFNVGAGLVDGSFYEEKEIYTNMKIPENQRGLLNGLASQILHEKMVDMQWQN